MEWILSLIQDPNQYRFFEMGTLVLGMMIFLGIGRYRRLLLNVDAMPQPTSKRLQIWDAMRGIAILGVIIIHTSFLMIGDGGNSYLELWYLSVTNNLSRFAIATFFFASGLLLKPFRWESQSIFRFYWTKCVRIVIPYVAVTTLLWRTGYAEGTLGSLLLTGKAAIPLYFVPALIQAYLVYPILDRLRSRIPRILFGGSLVLALVWYGLEIYRIGGIVPVIPFLPFFIYGMVRQDLLSSPPSRKWYELVGMFVAINIIGGLGSILLEPHLRVYLSWYFYNDRYLYGFAGTLALVRYIPTIPVVERILAWIGTRSLWIFLIHYPIQELIVSLLPWNSGGLVLWHIVATLGTMAVVIPLAWGYDRIYTQLTKSL